MTGAESTTQPDAGWIPSRRAALTYLVAFVAATYAIPFFGVVLSLFIPLLTRSGHLWPSLSQRSRTVWSVGAWVGLWLPAAVDLATPLLYDTGLTVSTTWLLIPLCGPDSQLTVLVPAAAAAATCLVGLAASVVRARPWAWVVAAWLAPWVHQVTTSLVPDGFSC